MFYRKICKVLGVMIILCFFFNIINHSIVQSTSLETSDSTSYGFIVPLVDYKNDDLKNEVTCKIRHLINDLLREKIPVFWTAENISINVRTILNGNISDEETIQFFERGSFIIPFTGEDEKDTKISAIIFDYNESSEIGNKNQYKSPVFIMMNKLEVNSYLLTEVKIAFYVNYFTTPENAYLIASRDCGFFTFDYIADDAVDKNLRNSNYNVVIIPGSIPFPIVPTVIDILQEELKRNSTTSAIRRFVNNGGGYIGSCYGVYIASYCMLPLPAFFIRQVNNQDLRTFGIAAIADVITRMTMFGGLVNTTIRLINNSHPVTYGLEKFVICQYAHGGPIIVKVGKNSEIIGRYQEGPLILKNSPTWISTKFGNGRVFLFSTHPEFYVYNLEGKNFKNETISNALFYTTYKEKLVFQTSQSRNLSFISHIWEKTDDLSNYLVNKESVFDRIRIKINESIYILKINNLNVYIDYLNFFYNYPNDTLERLTFIEMICPLFENDNDFKNNLTILKDEIFNRINLTISRFNNLIKLFNLNETPIEQPFKIIKFLIIFRYLRNNLNHNFKICFRDIPQIYFNAQKFLRNYWYKFEANTAIYDLYI